MYPSPAAEVFKTLYPPPAYGAAREKFTHESNVTPSLGHSQELAEIASWEAYLTAGRDRIEEHAERRIAFFFQQLIVCYNTDLHFEIGTTDAQGESSATVGGVRFDSAHSSTIPSLIAYNLREWESWVASGGAPTTKPQGFVYLKNSDTYRLQNSTITVRQQVNQADIRLDGRAGQRKLRDSAIEIINRASLGKLTPQEGLREFVRLAYKECNVDDPVHRIYSEVFEGVFEQVDSDIFFDRLLSLDIESDSLRQQIYVLRFKLIRECNETQSIILGKIKAVFEDIKEGQCPYFEPAAQYTLIMMARAIKPATALPIQKLFCTSLAALEARARSGKKAKRLLEARSRDLDLLIHSVWMEIWSLRRAEADYRKQVAQAARQAAGMNQKEATEKYRELFPGQPMSQATLSRIENDSDRWENPLICRQMAQLYGIDPGLFFPALFSSTQEQ
jgi:hypothetical protein